MIELSDEILADIHSKVDCFYELIKGKYDAALYQEEVYNELVKRFSRPSSVARADIEKALRWKYGKKEQERLAPGHINVLEDIASGWNDFTARELTSPEESHSYWMLTLNRKSAYISVSYIIHLVYYRSHSLPIIDRFNWAATKYFLSLGGVELRNSPTKYSDILLVKEFIDLLLSEDSSKAFRDVDKYLMMFGKHVAP